MARLQSSLLEVPLSPSQRCPLSWDLRVSLRPFLLTLLDVVLKVLTRESILTLETMVTREELQQSNVSPGDFVRDANPWGLHIYNLADVVINGLMEDGDQPRLKRPRANVENNLDANLRSIFPDQPPFRITFDAEFRLFALQFAYDSSLRASNGTFNITISHTELLGAGVENRLAIFYLPEEQLPEADMNAAVQKILSAVKATSVGVRLDQRKKFAVKSLTKRVGDIMESKGTPTDDLMLQKEFGKYLGGKRRKTKKLRRRVLKNPKSLKKTIR